MVHALRDRRESSARSRQVPGKCGTSNLATASTTLAGTSQRKQGRGRALFLEPCRIRSPGVAVGLFVLYHGGLDVVRSLGR